MLILGARRTGKTSFIKHFLKKLDVPYIKLNGEDQSTHKILETRTVANYKKLMGKASYLIIDEAQKIPGIGVALKLMVDELDGIKIIVTGSSMFDLTNTLGEPLTGRKKTFYMFPFSQAEYRGTETYPETIAKLEERIIYGNYPELIRITGHDDKVDYLNELVSDYLLKDILEMDSIRNSSKMFDLLRLIAFQTSNEVAYEELGRQLGVGKNTVERYLDLLSKVFVLFKVQGFSRNLRNEITKTSKWYFYDTGVRNALMSNFNPLNLRNDTGYLWENFILSERLKYQHTKSMSVNNYFWRTYQQQEIDWIEDRGGKLHAYEFKWNGKKKVKMPITWKNAYPDSTFEVITPENYLDWIT